MKKFLLLMLFMVTSLAAWSNDDEQDERGGFCRIHQFAWQATNLKAFYHFWQAVDVE